MTEERCSEIIESMSDDLLIDIATTCSNRGVALSAEMHLRKRYPSKTAAKKLQSKANATQKS
jgi:hypothetical protein